MDKTLGYAIIGGWLLGVIFSVFKLPLPVPPFNGLIAAGACLLGQFTYTLIKAKFTSLP